MNEVEFRHGRWQMVVQNNQRFLFGGAGLKRAFPPALGIVPIARDDVPQHAGKLPLDEVVAGGAVHETMIQVATPAKRAKQAVRMGERADERLRGSDFPLGRVGSRILPQRNRVGHGVIAYPVPGVVRALGLAAKLWPPQFFANDKEARLDVVARQHREHVGSDLLIRPIVEGERDATHPFPISTA